MKEKVVDNEEDCVADGVEDVGRGRCIF